MMTINPRKIALNIMMTINISILYNIPVNRESANRYPLCIQNQRISILVMRRGGGTYFRRTVLMDMKNHQGHHFLNSN